MRTASGQGSPITPCVKLLRDAEERRRLNRLCEDWEQPVVTGWHRDVLGEEEENVCLSIHLPGECCLRCCLGPASASGV